MTTTLENPENEAAGRALALPDGPDIIETAIAPQIAVYAAESAILGARGSATATTESIDAGVHPKAAQPRTCEQCKNALPAWAGSWRKKCDPCFAIAYAEDEMRGEYSIDGRSKACERCGLLAWPKKGMFDRTRFCSDSCRVQASKARNGKTSPSGEKATQKLRREALALYGPVCVVCKQRRHPRKLRCRFGAEGFEAAVHFRWDVRFAILICGQCNSFFSPTIGRKWRAPDGIPRMHEVRLEMIQRGVQDELDWHVADDDEPDGVVEDADEYGAA